MVRFGSLLISASLCLMGFSMVVQTNVVRADDSPLAFQVSSIDGEKVELSQYKGKVVLIVNVASKCGLTPQYEALQALYEKYKDQGLVILGFPCNQFNSQEPGTEAEIKQFCSSKYGVTFPMFAKVEVNGPEAAPLYKMLTTTSTQPQGPGNISWNFEKFLVGRDGKVIARFNPRTKPDALDLVQTIEKALK